MENTEQKHTPLPYHRSHIGDKKYIRYRSGGKGLSINIAELNTHLNEYEATGDFIIEACNSHYSLKEQNATLVEALKGIERFLPSIKLLIDNGLMTPDNALAAIGNIESAIQSIEAKPTPDA